MGKNRNIRNAKRIRQNPLRAKRVINHLSKARPGQLLRDNIHGWLFWIDMRGNVRTGASGSLQDLKLYSMASHNHWLTSDFYGFKFTILRDGIADIHSLKSL